MYGGMTVRQLKELLEEFDDDAEVRIMSQPSWPFEYTIQGIATRREILRAREQREVDDNEECYSKEELEEAHKDWDDPEYEPEYNGDGKVTDIFLCEGTQVCYGDKLAWDICDGGYF
jgi:hypothetical protein